MIKKETKEQIEKAIEKAIDHTTLLRASLWADIGLTPYEQKIAKKHPEYSEELGIEIE